MTQVIAMRKTKPASVGSLIDKMWSLRETKRNQEAAVKVTSEAIEALETELLAAMDTEGLSKSTGKYASAGISSSVRPSVVSWDAFYAYIHKNKFYHLLERRPSVTGCRELFETKGQVPGVSAFTKRTITLKTV